MPRNRRPVRIADSGLGSRFRIEPDWRKSQRRIVAIALHGVRERIGPVGFAGTGWKGNGSRLDVGVYERLSMC